MTLTLIFPLLLLTALLAFFFYYWYAVAPKQGSLEWIAMSEARSPLTFQLPRHRMERKDALPMLLLTVIYAATAFFQLGSLSAPQSFQQFITNEQQSVVLELAQPTDVSRVRYYPGLNTGTYTVECSTDGFTWREVGTLEQKYSDLFKWKDLDLEEPVTATQIRITGHPDSSWMELGEVALYDGSATPVAMTTIGDDGLYASRLLDEQSTVPEALSWFNSTYFDEIYHARTGYEGLRGVYPYEVSHPPLGKLILSVGISLFGMNPFGWRFMGTLFGVLMLPMLYVFLKNMFGKTNLALCGTALFAFDFMHLTQTRIATIDTYAVFFILGAYFFLYRYMTARRREYLPLFLSGLMFGIGVACKWTVIYAGAGLAVLYFINLFLRRRAWPQEEDAPHFTPWLVRTLLLSVVFFVLIPGVIYLLSYLPYAAARGDLSLANTWNIMVNNQKFMFSYHNGVTADHPYGSKWYQWIVDGRPILYYMDNDSIPGSTIRFGCFNNPVVAWGGLLSMIIVGVQAFRARCGKALFILVGFLAQLAPWFFISRVTFEYHYFPATLFLVLALCYAFHGLMERGGTGWRWPVYGLTGTAVGLYAAFYPVLVGLAIPTWYGANFLKWIPSWPF